MAIKKENCAAGKWYIFNKGLGRNATLDKAGPFWD